MTDLATLQSATDDLARVFGSFRAENDRRLAEIETKGRADVLTTEKVDRLNAEVGRLNETVASLETALARPGRAAKARNPAETAHAAAFSLFLRKGIDHELPGLEKKAMSVVSDPDGGYLVAAEVTDRIVSRLHDASPIRAIASVLTITADAAEGMLDLGEPAAGWVAETEGRGETASPQVGLWRIPAHELYAEPRVSQKLLDDAGFDVEAWLAQKVADKFGRAENAAFVGGSGVGMPRGFTTYGTAATADGSRAWGTLQHVLTGANGAFAASDPGDALIALTYALKAGYRPGACFVMARATVAEVRKLKGDGDGQYLWQPALGARQPATLLGYPVIEAEDMPAPATGSLSIAFGNFREGYAVVDRQGIRTLRDPYTAKPQVKFYTTRRVGGDVLDFDAVKLLKFAA
ncbi:phage major capsid protein [Zavarzinia compransoris]|uniref:Phage major capsid protein n=1 Tax=Zavarzinia compransoris TaxID=1264899 RepID=A0A317E1A5_9PROT|nr:phage major capsid protein [Zavarzinia compransoris]PWR19143.1 phage major capsid protein [Zavarzinia compransoris]TDP49157.1 HK97 family phage major capsid protein [Zavarzinia compransoris]